MQTLSHDEKMHRLLDAIAVKKFLTRLGPGWQLSQNQKQLLKKFHFKNHYQIITFVNAIAWMTHFKSHPPELEISRNSCLIRYSTSEINGLSEYDFVCASKVEHLFEQYEEQTE